jgi:hypothetical protein
MLVLFFAAVGRGIASENSGNSESFLDPTHDDADTAEACRNCPRVEMRGMEIIRLQASAALLPGHRQE